jgi:hypothetical protein
MVIRCNKNIVNVDCTSVNKELIFRPSYTWLNSASVETAGKVSALHLEVDEILNIINNYRHKQHPNSDITLKHLKLQTKITFKHSRDFFSSGTNKDLRIMFMNI